MITKMMRIMLVPVLLVFANMSAAANVQNLTDEQLLARVDSLASFLDTDFSAEYTIVTDRPGQGLTTTVAGIFRRDANETYVIVVMQPTANRGQGYLRQGNTLWVYDPQSRRFNTTSNTARFQNTNARNSDFTRSTLSQDFKTLTRGTLTLPALRCRKITGWCQVNTRRLGVSGRGC